MYYTALRPPSEIDLQLSMTFVTPRWYLFARPVISQPDVFRKLSQSFGVDEASLRENLIDFIIVPGLRESGFPISGVA